LFGGFMMKKITGLISAAVLMLTLILAMIPGVSVKAEDLYFTVQPQSAEAIRIGMDLRDGVRFPTLEGGSGHCVGASAVE